MRTVRSITLTLALALVLVAPALAGEEHKGHGDMDKQVELQGEVLDLYCFMKHPDTGQGADHAKCARTCINKGLPIGFKVGDEVYLIVGHDHESAAEMVAPFAGKQARLKGMLVTHHGVQAIEIMGIEGI